MSHSDKDDRSMDKGGHTRDTHKKQLKHHRNLNDSIARMEDIDEDDFFYETKEKFHRGR
jgi:hypothetical protein